MTGETYSPVASCPYGRSGIPDGAKSIATHANPMSWF